MPIRQQRYLPHVDDDDDDDDDNYGDAREQSGQARGERLVAREAAEGSAVGTVAGDDGLAVAHIATSQSAQSLAQLS